MFSGSYDPADVTFLLKPVDLAPTPVAEKERLIQSGRRHYSEMISRESLPSAAYLDVFHRALEREKSRFASDVLMLAQHLAEVRSGEITIVSLARAGTPIGALLVRTLRQLLQRDAVHYSVSIIRDRGIDEVALRFILSHHVAKSVAFVDGWTGKGVIARELRRAVTRFDARLDPGLYAVADLCGAAKFAATSDDYLIPSSVLGATISGLVSRSILNSEVVGPGDFHGCLYYSEFAPHDLSRWFVNNVFAEIARIDEGERGCVSAPRTGRVDERESQSSTRPVLGALTQPRSPSSMFASERFLATMRERYGVRDPNHIKPGLGEATRVLLRRVPDRLLLRDAATPDVAHLLILAREKNVPVEVDPALPYAAAALIKELDA